MDTALAIPADMNFGNAQELAVAEALSSASSFLPRLQIFGGQSKIIGARKEGAKIGSFGLVWTNDKFIDLGKEVDYIALAFRAKAMFMPKEGNPVSYFKYDSPEFIKVKDAADKPPAMNGNMYGPEYLLWIPSQEQFATLFCSNKTLRNVSGLILQLMKKEDKLRPASIRSKTKYIDNGTYQWWGCDIFENHSPLPTPKDPDWSASMQEQVQKFRNPPVGPVIEVDPAAGAERPR